ncbi:aldo/keto reductase [Streptomyces sp. NPDC048581]|uniref:aldo/keto reductase n=1 Tax=Streptomyces sp. NPDC048581 TaxID=3365572 RepID=UPI0037245F28
MDETVVTALNAAAIGGGYGLIDTAAAYRKEEQVGEGIRGSGVDRDEVFVTTRLWHFADDLDS